MNVFWDWNGTLCDDVGLSLEAVNAMLAKRGRAPIDLAEYHTYIDTPISKFYERLFDFEIDPMSVLSAEFYGYYGSHAHTLRLAEGVPEVLEILKQAGVRQFILSSSHRDHILPLATEWGIMPYFQAVLGAEDWKVGSKAERAKDFCCKNGMCPEETWFIGDLLHDYETASLCGASCLLIPGGHQSEAELKQTGFFCPHIREIPARLGLTK